MENVEQAIERIKGKIQKKGIKINPVVSMETIRFSSTGKADHD